MRAVKDAEKGYATKRSIPGYIKKKIPCGIERLNTIGCRYYGIIGLSRKVRDWYSGMFMEWVFDWCEADYILDLEECLWWHTGREHKEEAAKVEAEHLRKWSAL
jgi:hypothetical protein